MGTETVADCSSSPPPCAPLLSRHPINCSSAFGRTWRRFDDEVAAAPREALKRELVARARVHVTYTHTLTIHTHTHTHGPPPLAGTCARSVRSYVGVSLPLRPSVREVERERERKSVLSPLPARQAIRTARSIKCAKRRSRVPLRDWNRGVTCAGSYIARRSGGTEERVARPS